MQIYSGIRPTESKLPAPENSFQLDDGSRIAEEIRKLLESHFDKRITLERIGRAFGLSSFQVLRLFQRHHGISPFAYLGRIRIERAVEMLLDGEPIAGVAVAVGFVDQSHMTKHFKRHYGVTPVKYRSLNGRACQ